MMAPRAGDIVTVTARVEIARTTDGGVQVILLNPIGTEVRQIVTIDQIASVEPGPLKADDKVSKNVFRNKKEVVRTGTVVNRDGDHVWVRWDDEDQTVESASTLQHIR